MITGNSSEDQPYLTGMEPQTLAPPSIPKPSLSQGTQEVDQGRQERLMDVAGIPAQRARVITKGTYEDNPSKISRQRRVSRRGGRSLSEPSDSDTDPNWGGVDSRNLTPEDFARRLDGQTGLGVIAMREVGAQAIKHGAATDAQDQSPQYRAALQRARADRHERGE